MRGRKIRLGRGSTLNIGKRGTSVTTKIGKGIKITTGNKRTTITTKIAKGVGVTSTSGKKHGMRINRGRI
jgi:hypothetical protein